MSKNSASEKNPCKSQYIDDSKNTTPVEGALGEWGILHKQIQNNPLFKEIKKDITALPSLLATPNWPLGFFSLIGSNYSLRRLPQDWHGSACGQAVIINTFLNGLHSTRPENSK
jgi:hypothetical protein